MKELEDHRPDSEWCLLVRRHVHACAVKDSREVKIGKKKGWRHGDGMDGVWERTITMMVGGRVDL